MKKLIISLIVIHFSLIIANAQWVQMSNGMGNNIIAKSFTTNGNNIFAGTSIFPGTGGVYLSTNNGINWIFKGLNNQDIHALATLGNYIFAGTINGVFFSINNGTNWTQTTLNNLNVFSLATLGTNIFAGTIDSGVYISTNNGTNWIHSTLNDKSVNTLAISGNNIFAGTSFYGVYLSTNNGTNWTQTSLNDKVVSALVISGNNIFAGIHGGIYSQGGVYFSSNSGTNWIQTSLNIDILSLAASGNNIFAGTIDSCIYLSTNNGINWIQKNQGFNIISTSITNLPLIISNNYIFAGIGIVSNPFGYSVWRRDLSEIIGIQNISTKVPSSFSLYQNYPNPFNPITKIKFDIAKHTPYPLSRGENVTLKIYDILGKEIQTLVNEQLQPGSYEVTFEGSNLPSGVYFYKLISGDYIQIKKMVLIK